MGSSLLTYPQIKSPHRNNKVITLNDVMEWRFGVGGARETERERLDANPLSPLFSVSQLEI